MVKAIVMFAMGSLMLASAANAETVKLTTTVVDDSDSSFIVDIKDACGLKAVSVGATGATFRLIEVIVAYRAPRFTRDRFVTNKLLDNSSTGWLALEEKDLCVRRFYLNLKQVGFPTRPNATLVVYGLK